MMTTDYETKTISPSQTTGTISHWNADRGFGFLRRDDGGRDLFVHINAVAADVDELRIGQRISFEVADPRSGKTRAVDVRLID